MFGTITLSLWAAAAAPTTMTAGATAAADPRLSVVVVATQATPAEVEAVTKRAEAAARAFEKLLGPGRAPPQKLTIRLLGDAEHGEIPTVDPASGDILLYREPGPGGAYEASLPHEMVHAIRQPLWKEEKRQTDVFLFVEEGFAETLAREAGFPSLGFPTYGTSVDVAAGAWLDDGAFEVPLHRLIIEHRSLNFRCMPQAYTERLSFFAMLERRFGIAKLIDLAFAPEPLGPGDFARVLGVPLEQLEKEWRADAIARFKAVPSASSAARDYREKSPIHYLHACTAADLAPSPR